MMETQPHHSMDVMEPMKKTKYLLFSFMGSFLLINSNNTTKTLVDHSHHGDSTDPADSNVTTHVIPSHHIPPDAVALTILSENPTTSDTTLPSRLPSI